MEGSDILIILRNVSKRLKRPGAWIQGDLAVDDKRQPTSVHHASRCCLTGHVYASMNKVDSKLAAPVFIELAKTIREKRADTLVPEGLAPAPITQMNAEGRVVGFNDVDNQKIVNVRSVVEDTIKRLCLEARGHRP